MASFQLFVYHDIFLTSKEKRFIWEEIQQIQDINLTSKLFVDQEGIYTQFIIHSASPNNLHCAMDLLGHLIHQVILHR